MLEDLYLQGRVVLHSKLFRWKLKSYLLRKIIAFSFKLEKVSLPIKEGKFDLGQITVEIQIFIFYPLMGRSVETPYRTNLEEVDGRISYITVLHYIRFCSYKQTRSGLVRG